MNRTSRFALVGVVALGAVAASITIAQTQPPEGAPPELPPGWTMEDMMACVEAGTPGKMHEHLAKSAGEWHAKTTMWMVPDAEPMVSEGSSTVTPVMDGRYIKVEMAGEMPGMGMYNGFGIYGFDNVSEQFQCTWIDNHSTGIMMGTGELSSDGQTLTWNFNYNCPLTKKPTTLREVERITGENTKTLEMYGTDPKSGREYKMMEIAFTRKPAPGGASDAAPRRRTR